MSPQRRRPARVEDRVIFFDLNGTIADWEAALEASFKETVRDWLGRWSGELRMDTLLDELFLHYKKSMKKKHTDQNSISQALKHLPVDTDEQAAAHIARTMRKLQPHRVHWTDGAEEIFARVAAKFPVAVLTNLKEAQAKVIYHRLQLHRYMPERNLIFADATYRKPKLSYFRHASSSLRVPSTHCVLVGNSFRHDVQGALRADWRAIWLRKGGTRPLTKQVIRGKTIHTINSLQQLPRLIKL